MKYTVINCLIVILMAACGRANEAPVSGQYKVVPKTLKDHLFIRSEKAERRIIGSELRLNEDSTFLYYTCGNEMKGRWRSWKDSLL